MTTDVAATHNGLEPLETAEAAVQADCEKFKFLRERSLDAAHIGPEVSLQSSWLLGEHVEA